MLPSFYLSGDKTRAWGVVRAASYGAGIGAVAALLKTLGQSHGPFSGSIGQRFLPVLPEIIVAAVSFALLCAAAAALRNFIAQRLIWPEG